MESLVASSVQESLGLTETPDVDLTSDPPPNVFLGKFEQGQVSFEGTQPVSETSVNLDPFDLNVLGSVAGGRIRSERPLSGALRVELSEEEVVRIASSSAVAPVRGVELEEGKITVDSEVEVLGFSVPVGAEGEVDVQDGTLRFEPRRIDALGQQVPDRLARRLLREADFTYPLGELAGGAEISEVEVHEHRLVFTGDVTLPAL